MKHAILTVALILAGCASPGHEFWDATARTIEIDGRRYEVYSLLDRPRPRPRPRVQVIRMGYARRAEQPAILPAMVQAAEQASGCAIVPGSAVGDSGVMTARLRCPDPRAAGP